MVGVPALCSRVLFAGLPCSHEKVKAYEQDFEGCPRCSLQYTLTDAWASPSCSLAGRCCARLAIHMRFPRVPPRGCCASLSSNLTISDFCGKKNGGFTHVVGRNCSSAVLRAGKIQGRSAALYKVELAILFVSEDLMSDVIFTKSLST